jgi:UDPglucose--hexose-1-phosphate uridylyltransferase
MGQAPEWRHDPLTGQRILISPERAERPLKPGVSCPFCEGHESETPPEVLAYRNPKSAPNGPGWRVRVVPNRYAAVRMDAGRLGEPGVGVAEVFVECPRHETRLRNLARDQVADVLRAWRDRVRYWGDESPLRFAQVFHNEGPAAGASVDHCHSQLIAIPFVPPEVEREIETLAKLAQLAGMCPYCQWIKDSKASERYVMESERFAVFCPPAPRFPGESWLLPKYHIHAFDTLGDDKLYELADVLLDLLIRVSRVFEDPDFNLIVKLGAFPLSDQFHWRIELLPRTITTAGWEFGTGLMINTMFPETAARLLRAAR